MTDPTTSLAAMPSVARPLKVVSLVEATTYLVLLAAVVAKRVFDAPGEGGVPIMGPVHGVVYLVFVVLALIGREEQGWNGSRTVLALVLGAVPFGGYYVERNLITVPVRTPA